MANSAPHLEPVLHGEGFSPPLTRKSRFAKALIIAGMVILAALTIHLAYASTQPTPEEIIERQIEMNGEQWQELQNEKEMYFEKIEEIEIKQSLLHEQNQGMRAFQLSENL